MFLTFLSGQIPKKGKIYSVNEGNAKNWDGPTAKYVEFNNMSCFFSWFFSDFVTSPLFLLFSLGFVFLGDLGMWKGASFQKMVLHQSL